MSDRVEPDFEDDEVRNSSFLKQSSAPSGLSGKLGAPIISGFNQNQNQNMNQNMNQSFAMGTDQLPSNYSKNTLDEPVLTSIYRDLNEVIDKTKQVLLPRANQNALKEWDLWGPLLFTLSLSILLSLNAPEQQSSLVFTEVFMLLSLGSCVVTLNSKLLGGQTSFFQCVCLLGYSVAPLVLAALVELLIGKNIISFIVIVATVCWSTYAASIFVTLSASPNRQLLTLYPVILLYSILGWAIFV